MHLSITDIFFKNRLIPIKFPFNEDLYNGHFLADTSV